MSGYVSEETALSLGKFLGAKYVITGQLLDAGTSYRYRANAINVETAVHEGSVRLNVRNDRAFKSLLAAVQKSNPITHAAKYAITENAKIAELRTTPKPYGLTLIMRIHTTIAELRMPIKVILTVLSQNGKLH